MSHQTGIQASEDLVRLFASCKDGSTRIIKMKIASESVILDSHKDQEGTWEDDYDSFVLPLLEESQPCYILYKLDTSNNQGSEWLFLCYSPDISKVDQKMLYAASRSTLKRSFGVGHILDELFGTVKEDMTLEAYKAHKQCGEAPPPLTNAEFEKQLRIQSESTLGVGVSTKHSTLPGISFDMDEEAANALSDLSAGKITYIQLTIDLTREMITLVSTDNCGIEDLPDKVPKTSARYHVFNFKHTHEGDAIESLVLIYSMPGYACSVKERMLFSSSISQFADTCERVFELNFEKRVEVAEGSELTEEFLMDEIHPKKTLHRPQFSKPRPPPGRGAKRLVKQEK